MASILRSCLQSMLKLVNSVLGMAGIASIIYALWMFRVWQKNMDGFPFGDSNSPIPWFIYATFGTGIFLCVITCSGHIAAETANDVFLNHHWEEDFPEDPAGKFDDFKDFVKSNFEICQWIGLSVVTAQGLSILLSMILRALGPDPGRYYDSDDDYAPARLPLLKNPTHPPSYVVSESHFAPKNDSWNVRIHDRTNK